VSATGGGSGNPVTFTSATTGVCTVSGSTVTFVGVGTCTINANQAGNASYSAASQVQQSFSVVAKALTITAVVTPASIAFGGTTPTNSFTDPAIVDGDAVASVTYTYTNNGGSAYNSTTAPTAVGAYFVTPSAASGTGLPNYSISYVAGSLTIGLATQVISYTSTAPAPGTYGSTYTVSATGGGSGNPVTFTSATTGICTVSGSTVTFVGVGTCTINANQAGNASYSAASQVQQSFSVVAKALTITAVVTPASIAFGGTTPTNSFTDPAIVDGDAVASVTYTYTNNGGSAYNSTTAPTAVGAYFVTPSAASGTGLPNYSISYVAGSLTIGLATQVISYTSTAPAPGTYGSTYTVSATGGGSGNPVTFTSATTGICTVSGSTVTFVGVGTCTINANQAGNASYSAASQVQQSFSVVAKALTITAVVTPASIAFGGTTPTNSFTDPAIVAGDAVASVTYTYTNNGGSAYNSTTAPTAVGAYFVTPSAASGTGLANYSISYVAGSLTIGLATQVISYTSTAPAPGTYGSTYTVSATGGGSGNPVTFTSATTGICTVSGSTVTFVGVGTCTINANQAGN